jgi:hypothetical protein
MLPCRAKGQPKEAHPENGIAERRMKSKEDRFIGTFVQFVFSTRMGYKKKKENIYAYIVAAFRLVVLPGGCNAAIISPSVGIRKRE